MRYVSTQSTGKVYSFKDACLTGWAADGGMLLPQHYPILDLQDFTRDKESIRYIDVLYRVLRLFTSPKDISDADLKQLCQDSFPENSFDDANIVGYREDVRVLELFHGPTQAFKDLSLMVLVQFLVYFLKQDESRMTLVVGTSGDTGSSAMNAVLTANSDYLNIAVLYPMGGRCSEIQELQMIQLAKSKQKAFLFGVEGSSDDLDVPIEALFHNRKFREKCRIGTVNSVNIIRILVQVAHYVYGHVKFGITKFIVPTGAGGNITAAMIAVKMGVPIHDIVGVTNANDTLYNLVNDIPTGYPADVKRTLASAMDIGVVYNVERMIYIASKGNAVLCRSVMKSLRTPNSKPFRLPLDVIEGFENMGLVVQKVSDETILENIASAWSKHSYVLDPHTAVGYTEEPGDHVATIGCASPAKFPDTAIKALPLSSVELMNALRKQQAHLPGHANLESMLGLWNAEKHFEALSGIFFAHEQPVWKTQLEKCVADIHALLYENSYKKQKLDEKVV